VNAAGVQLFTGLFCVLCRLALRSMRMSFTSQSSSLRGGMHTVEGILAIVCMCTSHMLFYLPPLSLSLFLCYSPSPSLPPSLSLSLSPPLPSPPLQVYNSPSSWAPSQRYPCFENGSREGSVLQVCAVYWVCMDTHTWLILNVTQLHNLYHVCMCV